MILNKRSVTGIFVRSIAFACSAYNFQPATTMTVTSAPNSAHATILACFFFIGRYAPSSFGSLPIGVDYVHQRRINQLTVDRRLVRLDLLEPEAR